jgi:hypothetical protein
VDAVAVLALLPAEAAVVMAPSHAEAAMWSWRGLASGTVGRDPLLRNLKHSRRRSMADFREMHSYL